MCGVAAMQAAMSSDTWLTDTQLHQRAQCGTLAGLLQSLHPPPLLTRGIAHVSTHVTTCSTPSQIGLLPALAVLNIAENAIEELPASLSDLKEKKIRELKLLPNPIADKKVRERGQAWRGLGAF